MGGSLRTIGALFWLALCIIGQACGDPPDPVGGVGSSAVPADARDPLRSKSSRQPRRRNVIIYLVDTLRADHLGAYRYPRPISPAIDRFAAQGVTFLEARANAAWTRPSTATVLTGLHPKTHGTNGRQDALPQSIETLAERLHRHGYSTAGFVTNGNVAADFGLGQGFEVYEHLREDLKRPGVHVDSATLHRRVLHWLDQRDGSAPLFLYVHATDPHAPYTPPPEKVRAFAPDVRNLRVGSLGFLRKLEARAVVLEAFVRDDIVALYDAEIASLDENFGRFFGELEKRGVLTDALVVFTSDHGEEFSEHGDWQHAKTVYGEQLRVPLIVRFPDRRYAGERTGVLVEHIDIAPTVLSQVGLPQPPELPGTALEVRMGQILVPGHAVYSSLRVDRRSMESFELDGLKLIEYGRGRTSDAQPRRVELFDVNIDPREEEDLASRRPAAVSALRRKRRAHLAGIPGPSSTARGATDPQTEEALRALGYVQ